MTLELEMPSGNIAVLCAQRRSVYGSIRGLEVYDKARDARSYIGSAPVIAHPPCRLWGNLKHFSKAPDPEAEKELGRYCARQVIRCGGVLEHPFRSGLFADMGLPEGGMTNEHGFTLEVLQRWWGHSMLKTTWLFFARMNADKLPPIRPVLTGRRKDIKDLSRRQREATPPAMATWLVEAVRGQLCK
jgi:hypothetical protein